MEEICNLFNTRCHMLPYTYAEIKEVYMRFLGYTSHVIEWLSYFFTKDKQQNNTIVFDKIQVYRTSLGKGIYYNMYMITI